MSDVTKDVTGVPPESPPGDITGRRDHKSKQAFRTISEVADELDLPQHVLRFWETKFAQVAPMKRGGGRRYYRPEDVELLRRIKALLHHDGYTIKGVQKLFNGGGLKSLPPKNDSVEMVVPVEAPIEATDQPINTAALSALVGELEEIRDQLKKSLS